MTQADSIGHRILELLGEDSYGIWEIGWYLTSALGINPSQLPTVAAAAIHSLTQQGAVELRVLAHPGAHMTRLAPTHQAVDLTDPAVWQEPKSGTTQIWLALA